MGGVLIRNMNPGVDMNRVGREVEPWERVDKRGVRGEAREDVPIGLGHAVACLAAVDRGELKRAMKVGVGMGDIYPTMKRNEFGARRVAFGQVGGPDEVHRRQRCRCMNVARRMILKPVTLIDGIIADVRIVKDVEVHEETPILKA